MKKYRSRFLKFVALVFLGFPVVYLLFAAVFFDLPAGKLILILVSPLFWFMSVWAIAAGIGFWEMKRWSWYVFLFANSLVVYHNIDLMVRHAETHHHKLLALFLSLCVQGIVVYWVSKEVRVPYFLPRIRWWESSARHQVEFPVRLESQGVHFEGQIVDLSLRGCFIKTAGNFQEEQRINLEFDVWEEKIQCGGTVVWKTQSTVTHPRGIGVKFSPLKRVTRKQVRMAVERIRKSPPWLDFKLFRSGKNGSSGNGNGSNDNDKLPS